MIHVRKATPDDCERVLPLLAQFNNAALTPDLWRRLFHPPWPTPDDTRGFLLVDDSGAETIVGFFGAIPVERTIAGRRERIVNLTSWITLPAYRAHSLLLFKAVVGLEGTLTCFTPLTTTLPAYKRFGFTELETHFRILLPQPTGLRWLGFRSTTDDAEITRRLAGTPEGETHAHHRSQQCLSLLIWRGQRRCLIIFSRTKGRRFHFAWVHHLSDRAVFLDALDLIKLRLGLAARALLVMVDERLLAGAHTPASRPAGIRQIPVFRSPTLTAADVDNLYSELTLLGL